MSDVGQYLVIILHFVYGVKKKSSYGIYDELSIEFLCDVKTAAKGIKTSLWSVIQGFLNHCMFSLCCIYSFEFTLKKLKILLLMTT